MSGKMPRRSFIKKAGAVVAAAAAPTIIPASALGRGGRPAPSSRIAIGCIGVGGFRSGFDNQGSVNMRSFLQQPDVQVVAVCDVTREHRMRAKAIAERHYAANAPSGSFKGCGEYNDFRDLIARPDIDALSIAVPDHWHALIAIAGANAGKDIYAEKPLALTVRQGRAMVTAVQRNGVVFQTGSQLRSVDTIRYACELVRNGRLGQVRTIKAVFAAGPACPPQPEMPVPDGFDYDMWLGPAPWAPYTELRCHGNFRWIQDYSAGQVTDHGAHYVDIGQWGLGTEHTGPVEVEGRGDFPREGLFNTATNYNVEWTYGNGVKLFGSDKGRGIVCITFEGDEGWIYIGPDNSLDSEPKSIIDSKIGPNEIHLHRSRDHHRDFLDCIKTRSQPVAPIEAAHHSAAACHIGNIAMRLGRKLRWDPEAELFLNDDEANRMLDRPMRAPWRLG